jgi:hypothetical protein
MQHWLLDLPLPEKPLVRQDIGLIAPHGEPAD